MRRHELVEAVRTGRSQRSVAREFKVGLRTVQRWLERAGEEPLERVDWSDRPSRPARVDRTPPDVEDLILELRRQLREESALGEYGALAIQRALAESPGFSGPIPSLRTIGRILDRRGALDARRRVRRPAPPAGWYLPELEDRSRELDSFDIIEGLRLRGGRHVDVLTAISLHGGLPQAWPDSGMSAAKAVVALVEHWHREGLPGYAQFDNDPRFYGTHGHPDVLGPVVRLCLGLGVVPVFAPPRETGFQASIESFNGRWQAKVWARFWSENLADLRDRSDRYIAAVRSRSVARIEAAPSRRLMPAGWQPDLRAEPRGRLVLIRRTGPTGAASVLGRAYEIDPGWPHRLVRAELDLDRSTLSFFALRRREPGDQPVLRVVRYEPARCPAD